MNVELNTSQVRILRIIQSHQPVTTYDLRRETGFSADFLRLKLRELKRLGLIHRDGSIWLTVAGSEVIDEN